LQVWVLGRLGEPLPEVFELAVALLEAGEGSVSGVGLGVAAESFQGQ
jgi:hypothetical protein